MIKLKELTAICGNDQLRPVFSYVLFDGGSGQFCATDAYMLICGNLTAICENIDIPAEKILIHKDGLKFSGMNKSDEIVSIETLSPNANELLFTTQKGQKYIVPFELEKLAHKYPDYKQILPKPEKWEDDLFIAVNPDLLVKCQKALNVIGLTLKQGKAEYQKPIIVEPASSQCLEKFNGHDLFCLVMPLLMK